MPFVKCPECGKLNSVKLKKCPKCEAALDIAPASSIDTQPAAGYNAAPPMQSSPWGQNTPSQNVAVHNPWGQPAQPASQPNNNPWAQNAQNQNVHANNPWGQPSQAASQPNNNPWAQNSQPNNNPWGGQPVAQSTTGGSHCTNCGSRLMPGAKFCGACGAPVQQTAQHPSGIPTRKNPYCI